MMHQFMNAYVCMYPSLDEEESNYPASGTTVLFKINLRYGASDTNIFHQVAFYKCGLTLIREWVSSHIRVWWN